MTRTHVGLLALLVSILILLGAREVMLAQHTVRDLEGTVTDRQHEPLRGAVVQVEDEATHNVMSYITDSTGHYSFKRLGGETDYYVFASFRGHQSAKKQLSLFSSKQAVTIDLIIALD